MKTLKRQQFWKKRERQIFASPLSRSTNLIQIAAVLPIFACFVIPLLKVGNVIYIYDLCTLLAVMILGWPRAAHPWLRRFDRAWWLLAMAIVIGFLSAILRAGVTFRIVAYAAQFLLGLVYCRAVLLNCLTGRLNSAKFAGGAAVATLVAALIGILQFVLLQIAPQIADSLYRQYLDLAGFDQAIYEKIHLRAWEATGNLRVVGTWFIATTFGGMMALGSAWLLLTRWRLTPTIIAFSITYVCVLLTLSRHAWVIGALVLSFLLLKTQHATDRIVLLAFGVTFVTGVLVLLSNADSEHGMSTKDAWAQLNDRFERTTEEGFEDSSLLMRYVSGTLRFGEYTMQDPTIFVIGFGIQTETGLERGLPTNELQYGYVSNGWLLILRNCGVVGFVGLALFHVGLYRAVGNKAWPPVLVTGIIILSDNYSVHSPAPFFLILTFLTVAWAQAMAEFPRPLGPEKDGDIRRDTALDVHRLRSVNRYRT